MELITAMEKRQSIRRYKEGNIPIEDLREIIRAASLAPSGKNTQNWRFLVITDERIKLGVADTIESKAQRISSSISQVDSKKGEKFIKFCKNFTTFFKNAPALVIVYTKEYTPEGYHELGAMGESMDFLHHLKYCTNPACQGLGAAIEHALLRAVDLGYGGTWLTSPNYAANEVNEFLKNETGFAPEVEFFMAAMLSLGIPEDNQKSPGRLSVDEVATFI